MLNQSNKSITESFDVITGSLSKSFRFFLMKNQFLSVSSTTAPPMGIELLQNSKLAVQHCKRTQKKCTQACLNPIVAAQRWHASPFYTPLAAPNCKLAPKKCSLAARTCPLAAKSCSLEVRSCDEPVWKSPGVLWKYPLAVAAPGPLATIQHLQIASSFLLAMTIGMGKDGLLRRPVDNSTNSREI